MTRDQPDSTCFVLVGDHFRLLPGILRALFEDGWVASYQVGFGPPLVRSSETLIRRLKGARSVLEKLDVYLKVCYLDAGERARLAQLHRRLTVRRRGPVEAEELSALCKDVLDLVIRLYAPEGAPAAVREEMETEGVDFSNTYSGQGPEALSGRILVRLADPKNERLLHIDKVQAAAKDPEHSFAIDLRASVVSQKLWWYWLKRMGSRGLFTPVYLGDPVSHARVKRDGRSA